MRTRFTRAAFITMIMSTVGAASAAAQTIGEPDRARPTQVATLAAAPGDQVRQLTIDDAVRLALDNNLGIQIARFNPQVQDLSVALARSRGRRTSPRSSRARAPTTPNSSFLSGSTTGQNSTTNGRVASNVGVTQADAVGRQLQRRLGQHALDHDEPLLELLAAAAVLAVGGRPAAAAAQLQHRQPAPAGDSQREEPGDLRRPAPADDRDDVARRAQCVLGSRVRERVARRPAAVARSGATSRCARRTRASRSARRRRSTPSRRRPRSRPAGRR